MSKIENKPDNKGGLETATVARYKSVDVDGTVYGPGEQVTLAKSEVADLRRKGFLLDPVDDEEPESAAPKVKITKGAAPGGGKPSSAPVESGSGDDKTGQDGNKSQTDPANPGSDNKQIDSE